jgi:hypothetical protein
METEKVKKPMPTPQERPDLYDDFDGVERPAGQGTGVKIPDYIQKLIDERKKQPAAADAPADAAAADEQNK